MDPRHDREDVQPLGEYLTTSETIGFDHCLPLPAPLFHACAAGHQLSCRNDCCSCRGIASNQLPQRLPHTVGCYDSTTSGSEVGAQVSDRKVLKGELALSGRRPCIHIRTAHTHTSSMMRAIIKCSTDSPLPMPRTRMSSCPTVRSF